MTANRNLSVGVFVTVALLAGIALTLWVTGRKGTEPMEEYAVAIEDDVSGLGMGGPVYFLGVRVGEVDDIDIVAGDPPRIRVGIRVLASTPVNAGTWATLAPQGVTGISVINLSNEPGSLDPLVAGHRDRPEIPYRSSGFSAIMSTAPQLVAKMEDLVERAIAFSSPENAAALGQVLANIESLTSSLAERESSLADLPETFNLAMRDFRATVGHFDALLDQAGPEAVTALQNLSVATGQLSVTLERLERWTSVNQSDLDEFAANGLGQVPALVTEMRSAARQLEKLLERIEDNPSSVIYKPAPRGVIVED
ncbi:MCE family protein [Marinihelvus fidelis]|uniref:MCE family protein n=1 Tax=Marinihelvus fidelis TaxID=2613842 RepID=A0A5N0THP2_9GAMM|nr:MlaD family protein [Marinihelvus fidelis]KAA9133376.1 MCE family protein [Marinihelvus fidelis]